MIILISNVEILEKRSKQNRQNHGIIVHDILLSVYICRQW